MTNDEYGILINELRNDPLGVGYANMTDEEVAASLNEPRYSVPTTRFMTWRAIAGVLTGIVRGTDSALAASPVNDSLGVHANNSSGMK